ncbi:GIY-YIG nuclease family protein [Phenylobacterium sp.]|uniref:GIY-YIG nuclease family protein n=1 Tax=Phenylobacterium sp. TaxID=1871053 RepID=UPI003568E715
MDNQSRRQLVRDYKERKVSQGIFAVRCAATGEAWVGKSRNLEQQQNGIWFGLRCGDYINPAVQVAWTVHGEAAFAFDVLETIEIHDLSAYACANLLKDRDAHWRAELGAPKLVG